MEAEWGTFLYAKAHFVIVAVSAASALLFDHFLLKLLRQSTLAQTIRNRYIIGYSPTVLGCVLILSQKWSVLRTTMSNVENSQFWSDVLNRRGAEIFETLSGIPLVVLLCAQLLLDNTGFVYHISGIVLGALVYAGAFDWLTEYWFCSCVLWVGFAMCFAISRISVEDLPWVLRFVKRSFKYKRERLIRVVVTHGGHEYSVDIPHFPVSSSPTSDDIQEELDALLEFDRTRRGRHRRTNSENSESVV